MSFVTNISATFTSVGTAIKANKTLINGNVSDLSALTTTTKTNLVAALNEVKSLVGAGSATALDDLSDVVITTPATGHVLRHNGTNFVNALGTTYFDAAGAAASAQADAIAASQPLDADLTAIAALASQTAYGRAFLALVNQAGLMGLLASSSATAQGIVELATTAEATTGTDTVRAVTPAGLQAAIDALVAAAPGTLNTLDEIAAALGDDANYAATITTALAGKQAIDTDLTAIAALVSAADKLPYSTGVGTWSLATFTAAGRAILDDADVAAQRTTLSVFSQTEIGDITHDFTADLAAALV